MADLRVLSLGAGVQSSTLALMMERGEVEKPDAAIFADTKSEPRKVYEWLDWLEKQLSFPVYRVSKGSLKEDMLNFQDGSHKKSFKSVPLHLKNMKTGKTGILRRQCTTEYKIRPVVKKVRELLGVRYYKKVPRGTKVEMLMGISYDELTRMRVNELPYIRNLYPLVDKKIRRTDCIDWMQQHDYPEPPRSACTFCPYHSAKEWKRIKQNKEEWDEVIAIDRRIRKAKDSVSFIDYDLFLHRDCVPIETVDFDKKIAEKEHLLHRDEECSGMCGV